MAYRCEHCGVEAPGEPRETPARCDACAAALAPLVTCPGCATTFVRPEHARAGSLVQCARCRQAWTLGRAAAPPDALLTCARCGTHFVRPAEAVPGARVACTRCHHVWTLPPNDDAAPRPPRQPSSFVTPGGRHVSVEPMGQDTSRVFIRGLEPEAPAPAPEPRRHVMRFGTASTPSSPARDDQDPLTPEEVTRMVRDSHAARTGAVSLATPRLPEAETALRAAALAAPGDDGPRGVLADLLLERGDPLGRFIALQLDDARAPGDLMRKVKMNVLLRDHGPSWLPPGVDPSSARFHRGFLQSVTWRSETLGPHPAWRFVECLAVRLDGPVTQTPFDDALPLLREVTGVPLELMRRLARGGLPTLEVLDGTFDTDTFVGRLREHLAAFPRLRRLGAQLPLRDDDPGLTEAHLLRVLDAGRGLERLRFPMPREGLSRMQRFLREHAPRLVLELVVAPQQGPPLVVELRADAVNLLVTGAAPMRHLAERWGEHLRSQGLGPVRHVVTPADPAR